MGKKLGHLAIQVHFDIVAESAGKAVPCINIIKRIFCKDYNVKKRKDDQVYSVATFRIW